MELQSDVEPQFPQNRTAMGEPLFQYRAFFHRYPDGSWPCDQDGFISDMPGLDGK